MQLPSSDLRRRLRHRLLRWFKRACRDLPWRRDRDPYRIWISEIMLQQTQVATVIPYFERFLAAFPTVADLAASEEQAVLRLWEGLGYYRRARDLHRAARQIVAVFGGHFPDDPSVARTLPGIGRYTLGAILSQAYECRLPILEANSQRVLCRVFGCRDDPRQSDTRRWLWQVAEVLLPARNAGEFNQALMELGALVCIPATPRCNVCPLASLCEARRLGLQQEIPRRAAPPEPVFVDEAAVVVHRRRRVLLVQRPGEGRWAGLWEFPHAVRRPDEEYEEAAARLVTELTGVQASIDGELLSLRHGVTRQQIKMVCFEGRYLAGRFRSAFYKQARWVRPRELVDYPVSAPQRRLARMLLEPARQRRLF
jgi:A/G-specific adenine glycosylase